MQRMNDPGQIDANRVISGLQRRLGEAMTTITVLEIQLEEATQNSQNSVPTESEAPVSE